MKQRRVDSTGSTKRKATEDDIKKMSRNMMLGHDEVAGAQTLQEAARALRGGMEGPSAALGDVEAMAPEEEDGED